jgi:hypothetical protein
MGPLQLTLRNVVDPVWVQMFYPADGGQLKGIYDSSI